MDQRISHRQIPTGFSKWIPIRLNTCYIVGTKKNSDLDKELIYSTISKYADDTKNKAKVSNQKDTENFQQELHEVIYPWAPTNNMRLNGDKFDYHRIGKNWVLGKLAIETQLVILLSKKTILKTMECAFPVICPGVNKSKWWHQRPDLCWGGHLGHSELENGNQ